MLLDLRTKLKTLREEHHYSQKMVAQRLNCSVSIISSYETGERYPSLMNLVALSYLYHVSTDYLLGKTEDPGERDFSKLVDLNGLNESQIKTIQMIVGDMRTANSTRDKAESQ